MKKPTIRKTAFFLTVLSALLVFAASPSQALVVLFKVSLFMLAGLAGYWGDRVFFPSLQVGALLEELEKAADEDDKEAVDGLQRIINTAQIRRALIIVAAALGICLGL